VVVPVAQWFERVLLCREDLGLRLETEVWMCGAKADPLQKHEIKSHLTLTHSDPVSITMDITCQSHFFNFRSTSQWTKWSISQK